MKLIKVVSSYQSGVNLDALDLVRLVLMRSPLVLLMLGTLNFTSAVAQNNVNTDKHNITKELSYSIVKRPQWQKYFSQHNAVGTIVILDTRNKNKARQVYNTSRANKRFSPASTFKIPHSLFALESKLIKDEFETIPWDGVKRTYKAHNQHQTLRSAFRRSAVWVYDQFAAKLGTENAAQYLKKIHYGNADPYTEKGSYWLGGNLAISAHEQIDFLTQLHKNQLPFKLEHQLLVKDIMISKADKTWVLRAKTGWQGRYGWWVGWIEKPDGNIYFALNIDTPNRTKDLYKRTAIAEDILVDIRALPNK